MKRYLLVSLLAALISQSPARGGEMDTSANLEMQTRAFWNSPQWAGADSQALQTALIANAELRWYNDAGNQRAAFEPYLRWDAADDERNLVDFREAYWALAGDGYELLVGVTTVFWGVTESVHLVYRWRGQAWAANGEPDAATRLGRDHGLRDARVPGADLRRHRRALPPAAARG
jgi:hypothetical protein